MTKEMKKTYEHPHVIIIKLDNEISLALESTPPSPDNESSNQFKNKESFSSDPFNT